MISTVRSFFVIGLAKRMVVIHFNEFIGHFLSLMRLFSSRGDPLSPPLSLGTVAERGESERASPLVIAIIRGGGVPGGVRYAHGCISGRRRPQSERRKVKIGNWVASGASLSATRFRMAAALNAKPQVSRSLSSRLLSPTVGFAIQPFVPDHESQSSSTMPLAVDLSAYALQASTIQPTFLTLADIQRHYQGIDSDDSRHIHSSDLLSLNVSSGRSDSDSTLSPPSTRENVIVKHDSKRKKELVKDEAYWERRRKNNDAAKRSRDSRRQKEDEMASRAVCLERENLRLRGELDHLRAETDQLRTILLTSAAPLALRGLALPTFAPSLLTTASVITPTGHCQLAYPDSTQRGTVLVNYSNPS